MGSVLLGLLLPSLLIAAAAAEKAVVTRTIVDLDLTLLWLGPGTFTMGRTLEEPLRHHAEGPQTRVTLSRGFWLGKTEVTQSQYEAVRGGNPSTFKNAGPKAPVENVSWLDAMEFCRKLNEREAAAGRLPADW